MTLVSQRRARPGILDVLDLAMLHLAKRGRERFSEPDEFYESFFSDHDLVRYLLDARDLWRFGRVARVCEELLPPGSSVIDVGCGLGTSAAFVPNTYRYLGLDLSAANIERAARLHPGKEFRLGSVASLPAHDGSADLAVCLEVLEHVPDDDGGVRELARVVRQGGHLLVSVPRTYYWDAYLSLIGHYRHYSGAGLTALLDRHGFDVVRRYPMQRSLWRLYHYCYVLLRVANTLGRRLGSRTPTLYQGRAYPLLRDVALRLAERFEPREDSRDSTFVLARRREDVP